MQEIDNLLPHRPPMQLVDRLIQLDEESAETACTIKATDPFVQGHYPGFPIVPGVIVCECIFQTGALFLAHLLKKEQNSAPLAGVPVVTRIRNAKFKSPVFPDQELCVQATLTDRLANTFHLHGRASVNGQEKVSVDFACALVDKEQLR